MNHISSYKQSSTFESNLGEGTLVYPHVSLTKDDNLLHLHKSYSSFTVKVNIPSSALTSESLVEGTPIYALSLCGNEDFMSRTYSALSQQCSSECGMSLSNDSLFELSDIRQIYINDGTDEVLYYDHVNGYQISTYQSLPTFDELAIYLPLTPELCDKELTIRYVLKDNAKVAMLIFYIGLLMIGVDYGDGTRYVKYFGNNYQTEIDVTNLDTSYTKCMFGMFGCEADCAYDIKFVGLDKLDTSNVIDMRSMFYGLQKYSWQSPSQIDISNFDFSKVQYFDGMFQVSCDYEFDTVVGKEKLMEAAKQLGYSKCKIFSCPL